MTYIAYIFVAVLGCILGVIVTSFADGKTIRELQEANRALRRELATAKKTPKPEVVEVRDYRQAQCGELFKEF